MLHHHVHVWLKFFGYLCRAKRRGSHAIHGLHNHVGDDMAKVQNGQVQLSRLAIRLETGDPNESECGQVATFATALH